MTDRRGFIRQGALALAGLAAFSVSCSPFGLFSSGNDFKKWIWLNPETGLSAGKWKSRFEMMKSHGIHGVLAQVYAARVALYESRNLQVSENLLETLIAAGRETGIEVHAWMWTMPNNNPFYAENHPGWFAVNGLGQPAHTHPAYVPYYKFMCPNQPEVREFLKQNVSELASYGNLAGIHLDYIRFPDVILAETLQPKYGIVQDREYPEYDYCYCEVCREQFKLKTGLDPLKEMDDPALSTEWRQFRYDSVTSLVKEVLAPEIRKAGKTVTAAVFPNWENVRQQWSQWELDAYFPMLYHSFYNKGTGWIGEQLETLTKALVKPVPVYAGLLMQALSPAQLTETIRMIREINAYGYSLFDFHGMNEAHWAIIEQH